MATRPLLLVALAACSSSSSIAQRGVAPRPRVPTYDGQPMTTAREVTAYVEGGATEERTNLARLQFGAAMRLRGGPAWDATVTIDAAPSTFMRRHPGTNLLPPARGLAVGVGGTLRKSALVGGPFRLGLLLGAQLWRVPIVDQEMASGGDVAPAVFGALVPSLRFGGTVVFAGVSLQSAVSIPNSHTESEGLRATTTLGLAASAGLRFDLAPSTWLSLTASAGANEDDGAAGGALAVGHGFE